PAGARRDHGGSPRAVAAGIRDAAKSARCPRGSRDVAGDPLDAPVKVTTPPGLAALNVSVRAGARELVRELSVQFTPGEVVAILGRNGSGKTLTLHTLAGLRRAADGEVRLDGAPLLQFKRRSIALRLGLLPPGLEDAFVTTAMETVLIGRHPHPALL